MRAADLIREMQDRGIQIRLRDDKLLCAGPPGAITEDIKHALTLHKVSIIAALSHQDHQFSNSIPRAQRSHNPPLSFAQKRMWFLHRLDPGDPSYNIPGALRITGDFDVRAFSLAVNEIVRRHESLRTTFSSWNGEARQEIASTYEIASPEVDLSRLPLREREQEARRLLDDEARRPFDLAKGPLLRVSILNLGTKAQMGEREYIVAFTLHHIVSDGWSRGVLIREFVTLYEAFVAGRPSPLPELAIQYADYAAWQRNWLRGEVLAQQLAYWRKALAGAPGGLELPTDRPRPAVQSHGGATHEFNVPKEVAESLRRVGGDEGATLFMVLLAAFQILLWRYSGQEDICVGTPIANRRRVELEGLIGFLVNTIVLRADLSGKPSFTAFLRRVREAALGAQAHQDLPFERLVEELQPAREMGRSPLFQVMFVLQNAPTRELTLPGLRVEPLALESGTTKFDLTLTLAETDEGMSGSIEYSTALFSAPTIERMAGHYLGLLEGIVARPEARIDDLPMVDEAERHRMLVEWNDAAAVYPRHLCLHELFEAQAARSPSATAVVFEGERLGYRELNAKANQLARRLVDEGVTPETLVGVCAERSMEMVVGLLAILKAGGAYLPLDPDYPHERLAYMISDARPLLILTQDRLRERLPDDVSTLRLDTDWASIATQSEGDLGPRAAPQNPAYVIYTSGSTGRPKGVVLAHSGAVNRIEWMQAEYELTVDDVVLQKTPFGFDVSVWEFVWPLRAGARLVMARPGDHREPTRLVEIIAREQVTTLHFVPSMLRTFLASADVSALKSLRCVLSSGEELSADLRDRFHASISADLHNLYGPTEASIDVTAHACLRGSEDAAVPIGRPIWNTQLYILDGRLNPAPIGVAGELYIGGAGLARGYLGRTDLTAERFVPNLFGTAGERLYRTGDLARYRADGSVVFLGRLDHQVKIRGFRIELGEIEAALSRLAGIREAVVVAREEPPGDKRLVAYVVSAHGSKLTSSTLRTALERDLPDYMIPAIFVPLDALPLTTSGKVDRKALPAPDVEAQAKRRYVVPSTPLEERLCRIWADVLGLQCIGADDNFFELGGHSLLAVTLVERMRREGLRVDVRTLFINPTVARLAALSGAQIRVEAPPNLIPSGCDLITPEMLPLVELTQPEIDRIVRKVPGGASNVQDIYPLAPLQEGILFHHLLSEDGDAYLLQTVLSFRRRERLDGFLEALRAMIARHDVLRTAVEWEGLSEAVQVVWREAALNIEEIVLDPEDGDVGEQTRMRFHPRRCRLDVRHPPLIRGFVAYDGANDRWLLTLLTHHLILDHTTLEILLEEINAHLLGRASDLSAPLPFRDFVYEARLSASRFQQEAFFKEMLGDVAEPTAPFGLLNVRGDGSEIDEAKLDLGADLARRLRESALVLGVSIASLFHLAFALVLARVSGRSDVVFGTVLFGRMHGGEGIGRVVGMLINTLPLRFQLNEESIPDGVRRMHARLIELLRHEHASLALAQRCSAVPASTALFSALLNYRHSSAGPWASNAASEVWDGMELLHSEERSNYPFTLSVDDLGDGFRLTAHVASFRAEQVCAFMCSALERLTDSLEKKPSASVRSIDILPGAERRRLLVEWNNTSSDYPKDRCISELFEEQAARSPHAIAMVFEDERLTYAELNARASRLAHRLVAHGVGPEIVVGICAERSLESVIGLIAIAKAGGAYLPLDPDYPRERLAYMIGDARPLLVLTPERLRERLPDAIRTLELDVDRQPIERDRCGDLASRATPQNLAYIIYTSGSTGQPKGVAVTQQGVVRLLKNTNYARLDSGKTVLHCAPLAFDASTFEIWGPLLNGGRLVAAPRGAPLSLDDLERVVRDQGVTTLWLTASLFHHIVDVRLGALAGVEQLLTGGDVVSPEHARAFCLAFPSSILINGYGPTENTTFSTFHVLSASDDEQAIPIGKPVANSRAYILGCDFEPAPIGVVGEIFAGGDGLARGYVGRPDLTAERFVPDPFGEAGERLYRTGDLARYRMDGSIEFMGRIDHQVKIRGFRVELGEIEAALARVEAVREAVVLAREDAPEEKRLVAYVTVREAKVLNATEMRMALARELPDYMIPSAFVFLDVLPLTANGKMDRKALPAPDAHTQENSVYVAPRSILERALAREFEHVLQIERIGVGDNFFYLGGNSLSGVKLVERIRNTLCSTLPVTAIFQAPTIEALARWISRHQDQAYSPLVLMRRGPNVAPLYCIHPGGGSVVRYRALADSLAGMLPVYGVQSRAMFDPTTIDNSIEEMAAIYVAEIRRARPAGPYHLLGWSMGGAIAFVMAAMIEDLGEEVAFLGLLDSQLAVERRSPRTALDYFNLFSNIEGGGADSIGQNDRDHLIGISAELTDRERFIYAAMWGQERGFWRDISTELMDFLYSDAENSIRLVRNLRPRRIGAPAHVWWARKTLEDNEGPPVMWDQFTSGSVITSVVDGDHEGIVRNQRVHDEIKRTLELLGGTARFSAGLH